MFFLFFKSCFGCYNNKTFHYYKLLCLWPPRFSGAVPAAGWTPTKVVVVYPPQVEGSSWQFKTSVDLKVHYFMLQLFRILDSEITCSSLRAGLKVTLVLCFNNTCRRSLAEVQSLLPPDMAPSPTTLVPSYLLCNKLHPLDTL